MSDFVFFFLLLDNCCAAKTVWDKKEDFKIISVQYFCEDKKKQAKADTPYFNIYPNAIVDVIKFYGGDKRLD